MQRLTGLKKLMDSFATSAGDVDITSYLKLVIRAVYAHQESLMSTDDNRVTDKVTNVSIWGVHRQ